MSVTERMSLENESFYTSYGNHFQRYIFAESYCSGKRVLDAGCGIGYGSAHLAMNVALSVVALDISDEALTEATRLYRRDNLRFVKGDVERLSEVPDLGGPFDVVINFENIEHLVNPKQFLAGVKEVLTSDGTLVVSTPNGELTERNEAGKIVNPFHLKEFTRDDLGEILGQFFDSVKFFGQWKTPERLARQNFEKQLFTSLCDAYYNPSARIWRGIRSLLGKSNVPPPSYCGEWTCFSREFTIKPIDLPPFPWPPDVLIAACRAGT